MLLRKTAIADLDRVVEILEDGRRAIGSLGIDQWQFGYPNREVIESDIERGISYVVVDDDDMPQATAAIDFGGDLMYDEIEDGTWLTECTSAAPTYAAVHRVAVSDQAKGRGLAKFIMREAATLAEAQGALSLRIDTHPGNIPMQSLVQACGFKYCGKVYLLGTEDGIPDRLGYELVF